MNTSLLTPDGFPRADIDVAQSTHYQSCDTEQLTDNSAVRTTRSRIIHLRNDYKALMAVIETHIHEHFASLAEDGPRDEATNGEVPHDDRILAASLPQVLEAPFAKVNSVAAGSPAETAGLKAGDQIRNFGYVNHTNHDGLRRVGECVQGNEGVSWHNFIQRQILIAAA